MKLRIKNRLQRNLKKDVIKLISDVIRAILWLKSDVRGFKKELPKMFHMRAEKLIKELEGIAKEGETKLNHLVSSKINPLLDIIEDWLKASAKRSGRTKNKKLRARTHRKQTSRRKSQRK